MASLLQLDKNPTTPTGNQLTHYLYPYILQEHPPSSTHRKIKSHLQALIQEVSPLDRLNICSHGRQRPSAQLYGKTQLYDSTTSHYLQERIPSLKQSPTVTH